MQRGGGSKLNGGQSIEECKGTQYGGSKTFVKSIIGQRISATRQESKRSEVKGR
jgi:hypothetical protein